MEEEVDVEVGVGGRAKLDGGAVAVGVFARSDSLLEAFLVFLVVVEEKLRIAFEPAFDEALADEFEIAGVATLDLVSADVGEVPNDGIEERDWLVDLLWVLEVHLRRRERERFARRESEEVAARDTREIGGRRDVLAEQVDDGQFGGEGCDVYAPNL